MARNTKDTCKAIMQTLRGRGLESGCTRHELTTAIIDIAGSTRETRDRYMTELKRHRFVKQVSGGSFALNFSSVDGNEDLDMIGELSQRISRLETIVAKLRANKGDDQHES